MKIRQGMAALALALAGMLAVTAGELNPTAGPGEPGSQIYTPQDVYNRLDTGAAGTKAAAFAEPTTGPIAGGVTLNDIMVKTPVPNDVNGASPTQILSDKVYWGLTAAEWGLKTGTMPNNGAVTITPSTVSQPIAAGYHNGSDTVQGNANLVPANIKSNVVIFDVIGIYQGSGPRFTDNSNGTVTDNATKLIWTKNANPCGIKTWTDALTYCNSLASGTAGLNDGSNAGDWRLPNINELASLIDYRFSNFALSNAAGTGKWTEGDPFTDVQSMNYWSSSTVANNTGYAWYVYLNFGRIDVRVKTSTDFLIRVWPVR